MFIVAIIIVVIIVAIKIGLSIVTTKKNVVYNFYQGRDVDRKYQETAVYDNQPDRTILVAIMIVKFEFDAKIGLSTSATKIVMIIFATKIELVIGSTMVEMSIVCYQDSADNINY